MNRIATHDNMVFAGKALATTAFLIILAFAAYFITVLNNELAPLAIIFGIFIGVFGTISIVNPSWFADDGYGQ